LELTGVLGVFKVDLRERSPRSGAAPRGQMRARAGSVHPGRKLL